MGEIVDLVAAVLVLAGAFLCFSAALALVRFPNVLGKLHAITKPQVLGQLCVTAAIAIALGTWWAVGISVLIIVLQVLTAPVAANMVARSSYRAGLIADDDLVVDHLADDLENSGFRYREDP